MKCKENIIGFLLYKTGFPIIILFIIHIISIFLYKKFGIKLEIIDLFFDTY